MDRSIKNSDWSVSKFSVANLAQNLPVGPGGCHFYAFILHP